MEPNNNPQDLQGIKVTSRSNEEFKRTLLSTAAAVFGGTSAGLATSTFMNVAETKLSRHEADTHEQHHDDVNAVHHHHHHEVPEKQYAPAKHHTPQKHQKHETPEEGYKIEEIDSDGEVVQMDGEEVAVFAARVNGHEAVLIDKDMDGKADVMIVDKNDNGQIDSGEEVDLHAIGMNNVIVTKIIQLDNEKGFTLHSEPFTLEDGTICYPATYTDENGMQYDAILFDFNQDGEHDAAVIDYNRNGEPDPGELIPLNDVGRSVLENEQHGTPYDDELRDAQIDVINYEHTVEDGQEVDIVYGVVNGHSVIMADTNHDGFADEMWYDHNDDSQMQENEAIDLRESNIQIDFRDMGVYQAMHNGGHGAQPNDDIIIAQNTGVTLPHYRNNADLEAGQTDDNPEPEQVVDGTPSVENEPEELPDDGMDEGMLMADNNVEPELTAEPEPEATDDVIPDNSDLA